MTDFGDITAHKHFDHHNSQLQVVQVRPAFTIPSQKDSSRYSRFLGPARSPFFAMLLDVIDKLLESWRICLADFPNSERDNLEVSTEKGS